MGVSISASSAWVNHRAADGTITRYTAYPDDPRKWEFTERDLIVQLQEGPDVLDHDDVRSCAMTAFMDACGAR